MYLTLQEFPITQIKDSVQFDNLKNPLKAYASVDESAEKGVFVVPCDLPAKKIIFSGSGKLENDWDDVR